MGIFAEEDEDTIYLSRSDPFEPLSSFSKHGFTLEGLEWPSVEHYFQAMKFEDPTYQEKIRSAPSPMKAKKLGRTRFKKVRADWKQVREVIMIRAVYTKCRTFPELATILLETKDYRLIENSQYDYFWGCGRDRRGKNTYGQVLMKVRARLREEAK